MLPMRDIFDRLTISKTITASCVKDFLAAMATDTVCNTPRMRPIFGGMLPSDKRATEVTLEIVPQLKVS